MQIRGKVVARRVVTRSAGEDMLLHELNEGMLFVRRMTPKPIFAFSYLAADQDATVIDFLCDYEVSGEFDNGYYSNYGISDDDISGRRNGRVLGFNSPYNVQLRRPGQLGQG